MKWEYSLVVQEYYSKSSGNVWFLNGAQRADWKGLQCAAVLNLMGREGWELVTAFEYSTSFYFKRPLP